MNVEDNRTHCLKEMLFLKKFFTLYYRRLSVLCTFLALYKNSSKDLCNFYMIVEGNNVHHLSLMVFLKKSSSQIIGDQVSVFFRFLAF